MDLSKISVLPKQKIHGAGCEQFLTYDMNCYSPLLGNIVIFGKNLSLGINLREHTY